MDPKEAIQAFIDRIKRYQQERKNQQNTKRVLVPIREDVKHLQFQINFKP